MHVTNYYHLLVFLVSASAAVSAVPTEQVRERKEAERVADKLSRILPLELYNLDLTPEQKETIIGIGRERGLRYMEHCREMEKDRATAETKTRALLTDFQRKELLRLAPVKTGNLECTLSTFPYAVRDEGTIELPPSTSWRIYTRYVSVDERGNRRVDERIGLVLRDRAFDPVVIRLSLPEAKKLHRALGATIRERGE